MRDLAAPASPVYRRKTGEAVRGRVAANGIDNAPVELTHPYERGHTGVRTRPYAIVIPNVSGRPPVEAKVNEVTEDAGAGLSLG